MARRPQLSRRPPLSWQPMSGPYSAGRTSEAPEAGHEDGIVEELIAQFADPLAFYRELVQNCIDAGATSIAVALSFELAPGEGGDDAKGTMTVSVRDDGCG